MTLRLWTAALLALVGLLGLASIVGYLAAPELAAALLPAGLPQDFVRTFLLADALLFVVIPLWGAGGLARDRAHGLTGLALHAGAAGYVGLWAWGFALQAPEGMPLALILTPELILLPVLTWALRPGGPRDEQLVFAPETTSPPERVVAVFDGECPFCRAGAARLERWTGKGTIELLSLHAPETRERFPNLPHAALMRALHLVLPNGRVLTGAAAVLRAAAERPALRPAYCVYWVPGVRALVDVVYAIVAQKRYSLTGGACRGGACTVER